MTDAPDKAGPPAQSSFDAAQSSLTKSANDLAQVAQGKKNAVTGSYGRDHWVDNLNKAKGSSDWSNRQESQTRRPWWDGQ